MFQQELSSCPMTVGCLSTGNTLSICTPPNPPPPPPNPPPRNPPASLSRASCFQSIRGLKMPEHSREPLPFRYFPPCHGLALFALNAGLFFATLPYDHDELRLGLLTAVRGAAYVLWIAPILLGCQLTLQRGLTLFALEIFQQFFISESLLALEDVNICAMTARSLLSYWAHVLLQADASRRRAGTPPRFNIVRCLPWLWTSLSARPTSFQWNTYVMIPLPLPLLSRCGQSVWRPKSASSWGL